MEQGYWRNYYRGVLKTFVNDCQLYQAEKYSHSHRIESTVLERETPSGTARFSGASNNIILSTPWTDFDRDRFQQGARTGNGRRILPGLGFQVYRVTSFTLIWDYNL